MNDEWNLANNLGNGGLLENTMTLDDCLAAIASTRDELGRIPVAVKLHPFDIARLQESLIDEARTADAIATLPAGAMMLLTGASGIPVYPDADVPRGEPRWVYAADEVLHG